MVRYSSACNIKVVYVQAHRIKQYIKLYAILNNCAYRITVIHCFRVDKLCNAWYGFTFPNLFIRGTLIIKINKIKIDAEHGSYYNGDCLTVTVL